MRHPDEAAWFVADPVVEVREAKKSMKSLDVIYSPEQYLDYYRSWPPKDFTFESAGHFTLIESELPSWAPVQEANVLAQLVSYADVVKSGQLVHERLRQQLGAVFGYSQRFDEIREELSTLRQLLEAVSTKVDQLGESTCVPLRSFAPEPFEVAIPIDVVIRPEDDGFQASFLDANLHAYGETKEEALSNIKATILEAYQRLRELPDTRLGGSMLRQKQVLNHYLREGQTA